MTKTGLYRTDKYAAYPMIRRFEKRLFTYKHSEKLGYQLMKKSYGNMENLMTCVISQLKALSYNPKFMINMESTGLGYVSFKNGYQHGVTFYDKETHCFNPDIYSATRLECDYVKCPTNEEIAYAHDVRQCIFYNPIGNNEVGD